MKVYILKNKTIIEIEIFEMSVFTLDFIFIQIENLYLFVSDIKVRIYLLLFHENYFSTWKLFCNYNK